MLEGIARDLVRTIQNMRKDSAFDVSDRISLRLNGDEQVKKAFEAFKDYICSETLAVDASFDSAMDCPAIDCSDKQVQIEIEVRK